jgi:hypothetical protein
MNNDFTEKVHDDGTIEYINPNYEALKKEAESTPINDSHIITPEEEAGHYKMKRSNEYPSISDQLDMIYHAGLGGDEFQATIKAVKDAYPKAK